MLLQQMQNSKTINAFVLSFLAGEGAVYSPVTSFLDKRPDTINIYKSITTSSNNTIRLSANHLIYARKAQTDKFTTM